ncbi:hypothetical protein BDR07DRAFT_1272362, partial [Suillus spraguei]
LAAFHLGMTGARKKFQWPSTRVTTLQKDIVYSLFGVFDVHLPMARRSKTLSGGSCRRLWLAQATSLP